jgi:homoserine kinase
MSLPQVYLQIYYQLSTIELMEQSIRVKAPASVSNLNCGFDVLGLALTEPFDAIDLELTGTGTVEIGMIKNCETLSRDPEENVVGAVLKAIASVVGGKTGFRIVLEKGIRPGSGIGSSAASSAAAAYAANYLLGNRFPATELVRFAMEGERLASGSAHADNVAPALLGGITLVRSYDPLDIVQLNVPRDLFCVVIHPDTEVRTYVARGLLDHQLPLETAVRQWGNLGGLVAGLYREDYDLIGRSLIDFVAEPKRSALIPCFMELKKSAMDSGALGAGISGSGPSVFALCRGDAAAEAVLHGMREVMLASAIDFEAYISPVNRKGAEVFNDGQ